MRDARSCRRLRRGPTAKPVTAAAIRCRKNHPNIAGKSLSACAACHPAGTGQALSGRMPLFHAHLLGGLTCKSCHADPKKPKLTEAEVCMGCHDPEKVSAKTAAMTADQSAQLEALREQGRLQSLPSSAREIGKLGLQGIEWVILRDHSGGNGLWIGTFLALRHARFWHAEGWPNQGSDSGVCRMDIRSPAFGRKRPCAACSVIRMCGSLRLDRRSKKRFAAVAGRSGRAGTTGGCGRFATCRAQGFGLFWNSRCGASRAAVAAP